MDGYELLVALFYIALLAVVCVIGYLKMKKMQDDVLAPSDSDSKAIVSKVLKDLNIKAQWGKEKDNQVVRYDYQGGHFNITLEKSSPFARLYFLYFYQTDIDSLETVRMVCNLCNLNTDACRIVYTVNEKEGKVDVHLVSVLPISKVLMKNMIERVMGDAFRWQNTFVNRMDEQIKGSKDVDKEKVRAQYVREMQLIHEQEMTHQNGGPSWHESQGNQFELSKLLSTSMGLTDIIPITFNVTTDKVKTIDDPDSILAFEVSKVLIDNDSFVNVSAVAKLDFYDPRDPVMPRHLIMDFEKEDATKETLYYRVTMALSPISESKDVHENSELRQKRMSSVLLGYDLVSSEERLAHFRYVWKEAVGKKKAGDLDDMTEEEKTISDIQEPHLAYNYFHGRSLYMRKRFYEALLPLTDAFYAVSQIYDHHDKKVMEMLDELAYYIGCCYMSLRQYVKANYYLQLTLPTSHQSYTEAYVNCLVNGGDYRALDVLNGLLGSLKMMLNNYEAAEGDDDDEPHTQNGPSREQLEGFVNFVKRRKAYLLVNLERYDEAEKILKQLLDDPDNSDFALSELAYIQKKK